MKKLALIALLPACLFGHAKQSTKCPEGRTVELSLPEDVTRLTGCEKVAGIIIRTGATIDVTPLSELEEITGDLTVGPTVGVDTIAFNGLLRVGGTIRVANNGSLRGLYLPRLEHAGRIEVDNNAVLSTISLPRLADVSNSLVITDNNSLELVTATLLVTIGQELVISGHPKLELLEMPRIARMETIRLETNPKLKPDTVEALTSKATVSAVVPPVTPTPPSTPPVDAGSASTP
jgi:hypothetical protein